MPTEGYLLDTSVASWAWDGGNPNHGSTRAKLGQLGQAPVFVSAVTVGEVEYGLRVSLAMAVERHAEIRKAITDYEVLLIDRHTSAIYGEIRAALFTQYAPRNSRGRITTKNPEELLEPTTGKALGIQENDLWIVSTAVQYDLRLITRDQAGGMQRVLAAANYANQAEVWGA